ncbi:hypothetical protein Shyd_85930 [Streptomyces hydrogenans]|uniref:Uncharacterized protein n=1 Tax=Streptomyces hydrogenans TaxID=1873719 RepID=A0ABQ3PQC0_9ACTN|nr:hypothetical protein GCM10018784_73830 [Streptomyces hydrogenans]GHI27222.1 hypothetical protein Shyd_85930 [Streptomyces hydrogenans]
MLRWTWFAHTSIATIDVAVGDCTGKDVIRIFARQGRSRQIRERSSALSALFACVHRSKTRSLGTRTGTVYPLGTAGGRLPLSAERDGSLFGLPLT